MVFIGDLHGDFLHFKRYLKRLSNLEISDITFIQVGDFGSYGTKSSLKNIKELNKLLTNINSKMYAYRGNHDNPETFNGEFIFPNIKLCKDYEVIEVEGKHIIGIGGAISVDREYRKQRVNEYWEGEKLKYGEILETNIDIVVTHTAPNYCFPINHDDKFPKFLNDLFIHDKTLKSELIKERELASQIINTIKENNTITHHFYGHFHKSNTEIIGDTKHILLNIDEYYEI